MLEDNDFGQLGFNSLATLYLVFGFACFTSLPTVKKLGAKACLIIGALCYTLYVASFILPSFLTEYPDAQTFILDRKFIYTFVLVAAAINGFGASILWVA